MWNKGGHNNRARVSTTDQPPRAPPLSSQNSKDTYSGQRPWLPHPELTFPLPDPSNSLGSVGQLPVLPCAQSVACTHIRKQQLPPRQPEKAPAHLSTQLASWIPGWPVWKPLTRSHKGKDPSWPGARMVAKVFGGQGAERGVRGTEEHKEW